MLRGCQRPEAAQSAATTIRRLANAWQDEHRRWQGRDLSTKRYVYVWSDGVYFRPRLEHDRQCIFVLIGADASGKKELLAIDDGFRESEQSWHELLIRLRDENGLALDPELATGDGALGFWKAARKVWPNVNQQRCWVHKHARAHPGAEVHDAVFALVLGLVAEHGAGNAAFALLAPVIIVGGIRVGVQGYALDAESRSRGGSQDSRFETWLADRAVRPDPGRRKRALSAPAGVR